MAIDEEDVATDVEGSKLSDGKNEKKEIEALATFSETFSFGADSKRKIPFLVIGLVCAAVTGCL